MLCSQGNAKEGKEEGEISTLLELIGSSLGWENDEEEK